MPSKDSVSRGSAQRSTVRSERLNAVSKVVHHVPAENLPVEEVSRIDVNVSTEEALIEVLSRPYPEDVALAERLGGDVLILGAGGKMGPTLVRRLARALEEAGRSERVFAVSRYSNPQKKAEIEEAGAVAVSADLLEEADLQALPDCPNVLFLVGTKFGATGREPLTWAVNAYLPGRVAERFRSSRIVALSTGNVYPLVDAASTGPTEIEEPGPVGEYAQSCLGRERVFEHFALRNGTPICLIRLNYAVEQRYGVLLDVARKVWEGTPVPLEMGFVNVIWQGDANSACLRALELCRSPAGILNVTGPERLSVREIAYAFGERFGREPVFQGSEGPRALLNDASRCHRLFGPPRVSAEDVLEAIAHWVRLGGPTLDKPTRFEVSDGRF